MAIAATAKTKILIGTTKATTSVGDYDTDTWTEIKFCENIGSVGDEAEIISFATIEDGRMRKLKGTKDAGNLELTVAFDALDAGQNAVRAAMASDAAYNFQIIHNDKPNATGTPTERFFKAIVASERTEYGGANDVTKQVFTLAITSEVLIVAATAGV